MRLITATAMATAAMVQSGMDDLPPSYNGSNSRYERKAPSCIGKKKQKIRKAKNKASRKARKRNRT